jgi:tRNA modification GTPase
VGRPNVGKSSLFNALIGEERALVHELAGTTRDYLEVELRLGDRYILLFDTAGLREAQDPIEQMGIEKSKEAIARSDTVIWVSDTGEEPPEALTLGLGDRRLIRVLSKSEGDRPAAQGFLSVSAKEGVGLEALKAAILGPKEDSIGDLSYILSDREAKVLERAMQIGAQMREGLSSGEPLELGAERLRALAAQLEDLIGKKAHEDVLKRILGRFCIGK